MLGGHRAKGFAWFAVALVLGGCASVRPPPEKVPSGSGWSCGRRGGGFAICVRDPADCAAAIKADTCTVVKAAHCFTYRATDEGVHVVCRETAEECEKQSEAFALEERDVSTCAVFQ